MYNILMIWGIEEFFETDKRFGAFWQITQYDISLFRFFLKSKRYIMNVRLS